MKKVRITAKKIARYDDLMEQHEIPIEHACIECAEATGYAQLELNC